MILVTGGTGFVGRQVLRQLSQMDIRVCAVIREKRPAQLENCKNIEKVITTRDLFDENADWWAKACEGVDSVIHLAWYAEPGKYLQSSRNLSCLAGTLQLAQGASHARVRR